MALLAFFLPHLTPSPARSESVANGTKCSATTQFLQIVTMVAFAALKANWLPTNWTAL